MTMCPQEKCNSDTFNNVIKLEGILLIEMSEKEKYSDITNFMWHLIRPN